MRGRVKIDISRAREVTPTQRAQDLVAKASKAKFPFDEIFIDEETSKAFSIANSVVRRHGLEIQAEIARALKRSGLFEVFTNIDLPMPGAGRPLTRRLCIDLLVISKASAWAGAYEVKRGLGTTETARRLPLEENLLGLRKMLPDLVAELGFKNIKHATSAIISYYDGASFAQELVLRRADLDDHFGVPITAAVDALTREIGVALRGAAPCLFKARSTRVRRVAPCPASSRPLGPNEARGSAPSKLDAPKGLKATSRDRRPSVD